jgi:hypothetical protein
MNGSVQFPVPAFIKHQQLLGYNWPVIVRMALASGALLLLAGLGIGQERFESGKYKGFVKYSAFSIVELQDPITVREAKGTVLFPRSNDPLPNVLVEFRDAGGKIEATTTNSLGQFKFRNLLEGTYMFKTTLTGFQSVVGTVVLRKRAKKSDAIRIEMPLGV